jgi:hypothetical protein
MSYWVYLMGETGPVEVERYSEGGTHVLGGTSQATLNVTYNYNARYVEAWDGASLREALHGKKASEAILPLEYAIALLGTERAEDYWKATPGNAGYALSILLGWAREHPEATFEVS